MDGSGSGGGTVQDGSEKALLRKLILEKRRLLSDHERREKSLAIHRRFLKLEEFKRGRVIHLFLSFRGEVMTDELVLQAMGMGKRVVVPVVNRDPEGLLFSELEQFPEDVAPSELGIPEPRKEKVRVVDPSAIDLFVLPGVAFDPFGNRLGYGAGYYDQVLAGKTLPRISAQALLVGFAFELQLVERIPASVHDVRVHKIVTEQQVIDCAQSGKNRP